MREEVIEYFIQAEGSIETGRLLFSSKAGLPCVREGQTVVILLTVPQMRFVYTPSELISSFLHSKNIY